MPRNTLTASLRWRGWWPPAVVTAAWLALAISNAIWLTRDRSYLFFDPAFHLLDAVRILTEPQQSRLWVIKSFYPPGVSILTAPLLALTNYSVDLTTFIVGALFLAVLLASTYRLGSVLHGPTAGAGAAVLLALVPAVFGTSRRFTLDLPLAAMVALSLALIFDLEFMKRPRSSMVLGLLLATGELIKHPYVIFVAPPLLYSFLAAIRSRHPAGRHYLIAALVGLAIAGLWYAPRLDWFLGEYRELQMAAEGRERQGDPPVISPLSLVYYLFAFWHLASLGMFLLMLVGIAHAVRVSPFSARLLLIAFVPAYVVMTAFANKDIRFVMPLLPLLTVITAGGITHLASNRPPYRLALIPIGAFLVAQFFAVSYGIGWLPDRGYVANAVTAHEPLHLWTQDFQIAPRPRPDWGISGWYQEIAKHAREVTGPGGSSIQVGISAHQALVDALKFEAEVRRARQGSAIRLQFQTKADFTALASCPVVVVQAGGPAGPHVSSEPAEGDESSLRATKVEVDRRTLDAPSFAGATFHTWVSKQPGARLTC